MPKIASDYIKSADASAYLMRRMGTRYTTSWLTDNRRGRHSYLIPYLKLKNRAFYSRRALERFIAHMTKRKAA